MFLIKIYRINSIKYMNIITDTAVDILISISVNYFKNDITSYSSSNYYHLGFNLNNGLS